MYVRNQSFKQQCSFEMCNTYRSAVERVDTHNTVQSVYEEVGETKYACLSCCNLLYIIVAIRITVTDII